MKTNLKRGMSSLAIAALVATGIAGTSPAMAASINAAPVSATAVADVNAQSQLTVLGAVTKINKTAKTTSTLNVRKGTSSSTKKLGTLSRGSNVKLVGQDTKTKWYKIIHKGDVGYISNKYVKNVKSVGTSKPVVKPSKPSNSNVSTSAKAKVKTTYNQKYAGLTYTIIDGGVDWSKTVGKMTFLDGDFYVKGYYKSVSENPTGPKAKAMAKVAADSNMVLVIPKVPDYTKGMGYTWWVKSANNAPKLKKLDSYLDGKIGNSKANSWYMGYSGGAEYITYELAKRGQSSYGNGGAIILAGGGSPRSMTTAPSTFKKNFDMHWSVGSKDGVGQSSNAQSWSAFEAGKRGQAFYKSKGFKTTRTVLNGADHHSYNLADIMNIGLKKSGL